MQLWSRRLPLARLIEFARSMRYSLASGIMLRDALAMMAVRGTGSVRPVAGGLAKDLEAGWALTDALGKQGDAFPPLFRSLTEVGEETGKLAEVMAELERYYERQLQLRQEFVSGITWPVVQFVAAILVITGLIYILGELTTGSDKEPMDPLGLGLLGASGATTFVSVVAAVLAGFTLIYLVLKKALQRRATVETLLFRVPVLGSCLKAVAMTRFCVSLQLVLDSGASILKTFRLAFLATDNQAFVAAIPTAESGLMQGSPFVDCLSATRLFPEEFLSAVAVGEESGRLPEVLQQQAEYYNMIAVRRLALLNKIAGGVVWLTVAAIMTVAIIRIFMSVYMKSLNREM
ncbi:MAG: type II secretion system F family protein [Fimbriiglobus sp.]